MIEKMTGLIADSLDFNRNLNRKKRYALTHLDQKGDHVNRVVFYSMNQCTATTFIILC